MQAEGRPVHFTRLFTWEFQAQPDLSLGVGIVWRVIFIDGTRLL